MQYGCFKKFSIIFAAAVLGPLASPLSAYPGAPSTWGQWIFYEDATFIPAQISACADPDGRLRTLFVDTQGFRYFTENNVQHRVHHTIMHSFRPFPSGNLISEGVDATLGDYTSMIGRDDDVSELAAAEPRRTSLFSVRGTPGTLVYGGGYQHKLPGETFGETFYRSNSYFGRSIPLGGRRPFESQYTEFSSGFSGAEGNLLAALSAPGSTQNRIYLTNRSGGDVRLRYYEDRTSPPRSFYINLSDSLGIPNWATARSITGGSLAVTPDRRDFYCFVTSRKNGSAGAFTLEGRVWHIRTAATTSLNGDGETVIDIDSIETSVVFSQNLAAGKVDTLDYPQILLTSTGEPKWIIYSNRYGPTFQSLVVMGKRAVVTGFPSSERNLRSISAGYGGFSSPGSSSFGSATGGSGGLDRLDRLHVAYQYISNAAAPQVSHARESSTGSFESSSIFSGRCFSAPALAVGPGDYPYIAYRGNTSNSPTDSKLVVLYPPGLRAAYRDDYEDRDKDGRIGLLEFAQSTSDTVPNTQASPIGPLPSLFTLGSGQKVPLLTYQLNASAVHIAQDQFQITQGGDLINIRLGYSYGNGSLMNWNVGGFIKKSEFPFAGVKFVEVQDNISSLPAVGGKAFYRLQVNRIEGPP